MKVKINYENNGSSRKINTKILKFYYGFRIWHIKLLSTKNENLSSSRF